MRRLLPSAVETAIFGSVACICAAIALMGRAPDLRLAVISMPIFITAAIMGMRRHQKLSRVVERVPARRIEAE